MFESGDRPQLTVADVPSLVGGLAALDLGDLTDARRIELTGVLESLKAAAAAVQARLAVDFAESHEAAHSQSRPTDRGAWRPRSRWHDASPRTAGRAIWDSPGRWCARCRTPWAISPRDG